jgi:uncharacterized protein (DUF885 family)
VSWHALLGTPCSAVGRPEPGWPQQEQEEYILSRGELVATSVHEVFPGHYLQGRWQRNAPTFVQKVTGRRRCVEDCKQDEAGARQQAIRGTFDPGYFAYTLGKLQILELREEAKQRLGERFDLQRFHGALLAHGAPPIALIRERVLAELSAP